MNDLQAYVFTCIISADNDEFGLSEEDKQEIIYRHDLGSTWDYVLEPIKDEKVRRNLIDFLDDETDKTNIRALHGRSIDPDRSRNTKILEDA
jgi:bifunctional DNA-binding transcriptional regulator/antitoxin component of YhaV-PrlF toxin-antitoxin module